MPDDARVGPAKSLFVHRLPPALGEDGLAAALGAALGDDLNVRVWRDGGSLGRRITRACGAGRTIWRCLPGAALLPRFGPNWRPGRRLLRRGWGNVDGGSS